MYMISMQNVFIIVTEFSLPAHPSLPMPASHGSTSPTKHTGTIRHGSAQSDNIMLAGSTLPFGNPPLAPQHKSGSDVCLNIPPTRDGHKNSTGSYGNPGNIVANNDLGWLDLDNSSSGLSMSPTMNMFGGLNHSNPGSLHHDQFHMDFMNDAHLNSSNSALNRLSSHPLDMNNYFDTGIPHNSGMFPSEESTLLELGLSTS